MLRSPPAPVDKNIPIKICYCVVSHDLAAGAGASYPGPMHNPRLLLGFGLLLVVGCLCLWLSILCVLCFSLSRRGKPLPVASRKIISLFRQPKIKDFGVKVLLQHKHQRSHQNKHRTTQNTSTMARSSTRRTASSTATAAAAGATSRKVPSKKRKPSPLSKHEGGAKVKKKYEYDWKKYKKSCSVDGCTKYAQNGAGVCIKHGAKHKRCNAE